MPLFKATGDSGMPANVDEKAAGLLKPMPKKRLFVVFTTALTPPEDLPPFVAGHFACTNHLESAGKLFVSGPFVQEGLLAGGGLTCRRNLRQFDLRAWNSSEAV
jgi:hypothetical protein